MQSYPSFVSVAVQISVQTPYRYAKTAHSNSVSKHGA